MTWSSGSPTTGAPSRSFRLHVWHQWLAHHQVLLPQLGCNANLHGHGFRRRTSVGSFPRLGGISADSVVLVARCPGSEESTYNEGIRCFWHATFATVVHPRAALSFWTAAAACTKGPL